MREIPTTRPLALPEVQIPAEREKRILRLPALRSGLLRLAVLVVATAVVLGLWIALARSTSALILPGPLAVWDRFVEALRDGTFVPALLTTVGEAVGGWTVAVVIALPLGYAIGRVRVLEDAIAPYLAGSQAMPVVAIAPLLLVWLGFGAQPKVAIAALITFFPILATTASGVRGVPKDLVDAARVFGAGRRQMALYVFIPLAARPIFAGLKVAAALSLTGAVVGEFVQSDQGLGYLINLGREIYDIPLMFVAVFTLIVLGATAYGLVNALERILLRWEE